MQYYISIEYLTAKVIKRIRSSEVLTRLNIRNLEWITDGKVQRVEIFEAFDIEEIA